MTFCCGPLPLRNKCLACRCAKGGGEGDRRLKGRGWNAKVTIAVECNVWTSWQIVREMLCIWSLWAFGGFLESVTWPWEPQLVSAAARHPGELLRPSYGFVSVITLWWHGLKRAREIAIEELYIWHCLYKWAVIEVTVCLVYWILRRKRQNWAQAITLNSVCSTFSIQPAALEARWWFSVPFSATSFTFRQI